MMEPLASDPAPIVSDDHPSSDLPLSITVRKASIVSACNGFLSFEFGFVRVECYRVRVFDSKLR
jgi:hypothetical protein